MKLLYSLLAITLSVASCNGQTKTTLQEQRANAKVAGVRQPKMIKTRDTSEYVNVHCSLMDKAGNLWFGTTGEGVYRYDGRGFTQFAVEDGLSSNIVYSILEDRVGNIWFGTGNGASRYDGKSISPIPVAVPLGSSFSDISPMKDPYAKNEVWSMLQDKTGTIWFGTREGVYLYNGSVFSRFLDNDNIVNNSKLHLKMIDGMIQDRNGDIWLASGMLPGSEGLVRYDGRSLTRFNPGGEIWIRYVLEDKQGNLWIGTRHQGVWRYDGKDFTRFMEGGEDIGLAALEDKAGNIWFSGGERSNSNESNGSIWRYDGRTMKQFTPKDGTSKYAVWSIVEDRAGNLWFGTRNNGLYRYDGKTFASFSE